MSSPCFLLHHFIAHSNQTNMKHAFFLLLLLSALALRAQTNAQNAVQVFDPERDPVAIRADSALFLIVSEYVLTQAVKTRLGKECQVFYISKTNALAQPASLLFQGKMALQQEQDFTLKIPLTPDAEGRLYYASTQALICSAPGCNNCSIQNGNCVGCCANGTSVALPFPLGKVKTNPDK